jgi:hypothetical protein
MENFVLLRDIYIYERHIMFFYILRKYILVLYTSGSQRFMLHVPPGSVYVTGVPIA